MCADVFGSSSVNHFCVADDTPALKKIRNNKSKCFRVSFPFHSVWYFPIKSIEIDISKIVNPFIRVNCSFQKNAPQRVAMIKLAVLAALESTYTPERKAITQTT